MITAELVRDMFDYDPDTGILLRKKKTKGGRGIGKPVGCLSRGYLIVGINNSTYQAHRVIWLWMYGEHPPELVDHINGDPSDNRIANLRLASRRENNQNSTKKKTNKSGWKGVSWDKQKSKWMARIMSSQHLYHIGYFDDVREAAEAYMFKALEFHGDFARLQ